MNKETVSVIIPIYNDEKYLKQCVESVLTQTYTDLEVILIDDGSTDSTPEICENYRQKDKRVRVLHKTNGGVGSSRNAGLAMATGEYVLFVDHDDWLGKRHIESLHRLLKENDADIAACNYLEFKEENATFVFHISDKDYFEKVFSIPEWFKYEYRMDYYCLSVIFAVPWCKLYKRSLLENIAYPVDAPVEDDLTSWKIYLLANKVAYMNKAMYTHRILKESVSAKVNLTAVFPLSAVEDRLSFLKLLGFDTSVEEEAYRWRLNICKENALKNGDIVMYKNAVQKLAILQKYGKK